MGLGLPLAHRLVKAMSSTLTIDAQPHYGTSVGFTITAPLVLSPQGSR